MMFADPMLPNIILRVLRAGMSVLISKTTVTTTTKTKGG